jgi:hypothetical protein
VDQAAPYRATRVAAVATAVTDATDPNLPVSPERAWPGPPLPGDPMATGPGLGCVDAGVDQAAQVLAAGAAATAITPWTSGGIRWMVALRPLLPDETGCVDLGR